MSEGTLAHHRDAHSARFHYAGNPFGRPGCGVDVLYVTEPERACSILEFACGHPVVAIEVFLRTEGARQVPEALMLSLGGVEIFTIRLSVAGMRGATVSLVRDLLDMATVTKGMFNAGGKVFHLVKWCGLSASPRSIFCVQAAAAHLRVAPHASLCRIVSIFGSSPSIRSAREVQWVSGEMPSLRHLESHALLVARLVPIHIVQALALRLRYVALGRDDGLFSFRNGLDELHEGLKMLRSSDYLAHGGLSRCPSLLAVDSSAWLRDSFNMRAGDPFGESSEN